MAEGGWTERIKQYTQDFEIQKWVSVSDCKHFEMNSLAMRANGHDSVVLQGCRFNTKWWAKFWIRLSFAMLGKEEFGVEREENYSGQVWT